MARGKRRRREKGDGGLHQRADGMWIAQVWREDGTRYQRGRKRYDDAFAELRKMVDEVNQGVDPARGVVTVTDWLTEWCRDIAPRRIKPNTLDTYRSCIKNNITPHIGSKPIGSLQPRDIRAMHTKITAKKSTRTGQIAFNILSKALDDAVNERLITANPCGRMDRPESRSEERDPLTVDQARAILLHVAQSGDPRAAARWSLALLTGARQAEVLGLTWDRVDLDHDQIDISHQLRRIKLVKGWGRPADPVYPREAFDVRPEFDFTPVWRGACLVDTKTRGSRRIIPLLTPVHAALESLGGPSPRSGLVFTREDGTPTVAADDTTEWRQLCVDAGIVAKIDDAPDQHASRNTVATLLLEAGVEESVRMQILGHTTVTAHRGYVSTSTDVTRAALGKMETMLKLEG